MKTAVLALALASIMPAMAFDIPGAGKLKESAGAAAADKALEGMTKQLKEIQNDKGPIVFKTGKAVIDVEKCKTTLETAASIINNFPGSSLVVRVEGYTDSKGSVQANKRISQQRAQAVVNWLKSTGKVDAKLLTAKGFGPENPIADNTTEEGRAKNRRVDFTVMRAAK